MLVAKQSENWVEKKKRGLEKGYFMLPSQY